MIHNPFQGRIQAFKLGGAHLKKLRRAAGSAKNVGAFRVIFFTHVVRALVVSCALVICQCELCSGGGVFVSGECLLRLNMAFNTLPFKLIKGRGGSRGGRTRPTLVTNKNFHTFFS
jgi:hypothetical protein